MNMNPHLLAARRKTPRPGSGGFSLLEILVALAVLMIIALMVSMVFRQSSEIWNSSSKRAEVEMVARGIVSRIQEDLAQAIPVSSYTNSVIAGGGVAFTHTFTTTEVGFVVLREKGPYFITYNTGSGIQRSETRIIYSSNAWRLSPLSSDTVSTTMHGAGGITITFTPDGNFDGYTLPSRVDIQAAITFAKGYYGHFSGMSYGPNNKERDMGGKDVIFVGGGNND